jgi:hypothetical protein
MSISPIVLHAKNTPLATTRLQQRQGAIHIDEAFETRFASELSRFIPKQTTSLSDETPNKLAKYANLLLNAIRNGDDLLELHGLSDIFSSDFLGTPTAWANKPPSLLRSSLASNEQSADGVQVILKNTQGHKVNNGTIHLIITSSDLADEESRLGVIEQWQRDMKTLALNVKNNTPQSKTY